MKKLLFLIIMVCTTMMAHAQKVYSTDHDYQADVKVYVVDHDYQADLKIYFVNHDYQAGWCNKSKQYLMYPSK